MLNTKDRNSNARGESSSTSRDGEKKRRHDEGRLQIKCVDRHYSDTESRMDRGRYQGTYAKHHQRQTDRTSMKWSSYKMKKTKERMTALDDRSSNGDFRSSPSKKKRKSRHDNYCNSLSNKTSKLNKSDRYDRVSDRKLARSSRY